VLLGKDVPSWLKLDRAIEGADMEMGFGRQPRVFTALVAEFRCFHNQSISCGEKVRKVGCSPHKLQYISIHEIYKQSSKYLSSPEADLF
jgi:hypothetical protein